MKTSEIITKYQALSQVYHGAGADPVAQKMYEAGYAALAEACGGMETLNAVTGAYASEEELPDEWPVETPVTEV